MQHPLAVGTRCRLSPSHIEILRREGRYLSEAQQTLEILASGIIGRDIENVGYSLDGGVGYKVKYFDSTETCSIDAEELDESYVVMKSSTTTSASTSGGKSAKKETKAYCNPKTCFNPACQSGLVADKRCSKCRWAKYCTVACQKSHWRAHHQECANLALNHECMYGRPGYKANKESRKPPPERWNVARVKNGNTLCLQKVIIFPCFMDIACNDAALWGMVNAYLENGNGCSVDVQREPNGNDVVVAVHNEKL